MAHSRIQFSLYVPVSLLSQMLNGLCELFPVLITGILLSREKQDLQFRVMHLPSVFPVSFLHQLAQGKKSVRCERKSAMGIFLISLLDLRICAAPRKTALLFGKSCRKRPERQCLQQLAPVMPPKDQRLSMSEKHAEIQQIIFAGRTGQDHPVQFPVIFFQIRAHHQRTHTVSQQIKRQPRPPALRIGCDLMQILHQRPAAAAIHISQILLASDTCAVSAMIMDDTCHALFGHGFHKLLIPLFVFTHPMADLKHRPHVGSFRRLRDQDFQQKPVHPG